MHMKASAAIHVPLINRPMLNPLPDQPVFKELIPECEQDLPNTILVGSMNLDVVRGEEKKISPPPDLEFYYLLVRRLYLTGARDLQDILEVDFRAEGRGASDRHELGHVKNVIETWHLVYARFALAQSDP